MKQSLSYKVFSICNYTFLTLLGLVTLYPFYFILIYALSDPMQVVGDPSFLLPRGFSLINFTQIFTKNNMITPFIVSLSRTVIGSVLTLIGCSMLAYGLSNRATPLRKFLYIAIIMTMYINAGLIPGYLLMYNLNMLNTFWVYVIPGMINAFFLVLLKTYFEQLPLELEEAAMLDGAGYFKIFWRIILPLSKPILATITIFAAVGQWNNWMDNMLYNTDQSLMTLQLMLLRFIQSQSYSLRDAALLAASSSVIEITPTSLRMAITVVVVAPVFLVYPFMQKYFVKGIMIGAVKG